MSSIKSYAEAEAHLAGGRDKARRKASNNTYIERRDETTIAVKLHHTDVVTYKADGAIILNTGGWLTVTTKDRINAFAPNRIRVYSRRTRAGSRWVVGLLKPGEHPYDAHESVPFEDGILLIPGKDGGYSARTTTTEADIDADDAANAAMNRKITKYAALYTDEKLKELVKAAQADGLAGDCWYCGMLTDDGVPWGDSTGNIDHLIGHMADGYVMLSLAMNALVYKGQDREWAQRIILYGYGYRVREAVRAYLRNHLYTTGVAVKNGRRPTDVAPELLHRQGF